MIVVRICNANELILIIFNVDNNDTEESRGSDELYEPNSDKESDEFERGNGTNKGGPKKYVIFSFHFCYLVIGYHFVRNNSGKKNLLQLFWKKQNGERPQTQTYLKEMNAL